MVRSSNMVYKMLVIVVILLFQVMSVTPSIGIYNEKKASITVSNGNTLYVGGSGPGNYSKIQDAINDANNGDSVYVYNDSSPYYECILINRSINLIGEDKYTTEITADWSTNRYIVKISANFVNINGFFINKSDKPHTFGIILESCNNNITENLIKGDYGQYRGINISNSSNNNTIMGNIITDWEVGIYQKYSNNNIISNNIISSNKYFGIYFSSSSKNTFVNNNFLKNEHDLKLIKSCNNIISNNTFLETRCCTCIGISESNKNRITFNKITQNGWGGCIILTYHSFENIISNNTLSNSTDCIGLWYSCCNNTITNNTISNNDHSIYIEELSNNNTIYHNNMINNTNKAYDEGNNSWDDGYPSGGNYWDDYNGTDSDGDGIGDTPYPIPGGNNSDRYPLMVPLGENNPPTTPVIEGKRRFNEGEGGQYPYTIYSIDPDGDELLYFINWSDGFTEWIGPYPSGEKIIRNVTIPSKKGNYIIFKIKAKDIYEAESDWAILEVIVPRNKITNNPRFHWFLPLFPLLERLLSFIFT